MTTKSGLRVGYIPYLNCVPYFHYLQSCDFNVELISGVPSTLNSLLQEEALDISPSSSFEYARHWQDYCLLPGHSISSIGKVDSVLLFSPVELAELEGSQIAITGESATSVNLMRIILREFVQLKDFTDTVPVIPVEDLIREGTPSLLIGDRALRMAAASPEDVKIFDLGELWYQYTGVPFVFALWMIRKGALPDANRLVEILSDQLAKSYAKVMCDPFVVAEQYTMETGLSVPQIVDYWHCIDYRLEQQHVDGLKLFFKLCRKYQLIDSSPKLEFFQTTDHAEQISG